jgi:hypothetical protein
VGQRFESFRARQSFAHSTVIALSALFRGNDHGNSTQLNASALRPDIEPAAAPRSGPVGIASLTSRECCLIDLSSFSVFNPNLCVAPRTQFVENVTNMLGVVAEDAAYTSIGVPPPNLPRHSNHPVLADTRTPARPRACIKKHVEGLGQVDPFGEVFFHAAKRSLVARRIRKGRREATAARAGQQRHSSKHSRTLRPSRRCARCSGTGSAAAGGDREACSSETVRRPPACAERLLVCRVRFGAASLRFVASLADGEAWMADRLVRLARWACEA